MTLLKRACVWVDYESVAPVARLYFAEALQSSAIADENVIRFDVCRAVRWDGRTSSRR